jgi:hypothetical protein
MKLLFMTSMAILFTGTCALAEPMTSGRPTAVLNNAQCQDVWAKVHKDGDSLLQEKARPWIVNFKLVDSDGDGKVSHDEFTFACGKGMVDPNPST